MKYHMPRNRFLELREENTKAVKEKYTKLGFEHVFVVDPGEFVICDLCNAEISESLICIDTESHQAVCKDCQLEAHEKLND